MCQTCETKPVYEFTNKRRLCRRCFINWFQKKVLYTIRKFEMINRGDIVGYEEDNNYREVVLKNILKMFSKKYGVEIVELNYRSKLKVNKIAVSSTIDLEADKIVHELIKGKIKNLKEVAPIQNKIIKPLYLFLDKEVLLYAMMKKFKYKEVKSVCRSAYPQLRNEGAKDEISLFVDELEEKHPEIKRAVVNGWSGINE